MTRWLLNTFPTWGLVLMHLVVFVGTALLSQAVIHRRFPRYKAGDHNALASTFLVAFIGMYGIIVAFVIIVLFQDFNSASSNVEAEASELAGIYRDSAVFTNEGGDDLRGALRDYAVTVVESEWDALAVGGDSERAWNDVDAMFVALQAIEPKTEAEKAFYSEDVQRLNELVAARRTRIEDAEHSLPGEFLALIIGGGLLLVMFLGFFGGADNFSQRLMAGGVAALVGFNVLIVILMDHPFSGDVAVTSHPFMEGALAALF